MKQSNQHMNITSSNINEGTQVFGSNDALSYEPKLKIDCP